MAESLNIPNFDTMNHDDLMSFWMRHQHGRGRKLLGLTGKGSVNTTGSLAHYAANKAAAITCRLRRDIQAALVYETICDNIYSSLPTEVKW